MIHPKTSSKVGRLRILISVRGLKDEIIFKSMNKKSLHKTIPKGG
jgi:hypothetical protein